MEDLEYLRCSRVSRVDVLCLNIDIQRHRECVLIKMIDLKAIVSSINNHILLLMNLFNLIDKCISFINKLIY